MKPKQDEPNSFDSKPEFQHFKNVMRKLIAVPKAELDALVKAAKEASPRIGDPRAGAQAGETLTWSKTIGQHNGRS